ncbi:hypothetical protein AVEN_85743-1 [Araneus ventricosus]|uniref:Uncharacterized protein n=1 Tax=Araneus ventricosus TaxID=182803 RepID=A0A4Y2L2H8_ARAVE|nr:hypothetical protein AVEN_85743-1 [Araneus ventricosus]
MDFGYIPLTDQVQNLMQIIENIIHTVLPAPEKPQTPDMPVAVVMETGYSTAIRSEGKGFISFGADRTGGNLISLCTSVEKEFLA